MAVRSRYTGFLEGMLGPWGMNLRSLLSFWGSEAWEIEFVILFIALSCWCLNDVFVIFCCVLKVLWVEPWLAWYRNVCLDHCDLALGALDHLPPSDPKTFLGGTVTTLVHCMSSSWQPSPSLGILDRAAHQLERATSGKLADTEIQWYSSFMEDAEFSSSWSTCYSNPVLFIVFAKYVHTYYYIYSRHAVYFV